MASEQHHAERGLRDQIERYRTAFISVVTMIVLALLVGGYILANERLSVPSWVPVIGKEHFMLRADFSTGQAVTPGQGQSVTIAGAKIGEIASVGLHEGRALVTMSLTPKYARHIYRNATLLLRPKTQLKDMTVEIDPGTPSAGRIPKDFDVPLSQSAPDVSFDEFLAGLDAETRAALQELLAGAAQGLKGNAARLSAAFKRFDPLARDLRQITAQLQLREENISHSVHNFQLILSALGGKDRELAQLIDASNANFQTFAEEDANFQKTLHLLPGALSKTRKSLGKLSAAARVVGPTLKALEPFAKGLAPAEEASRPLFAHTTPILKREIRPLAREILPTVDQLQPSLRQLGEAFPHLASSFAVFNELVNELGYNPGAGKGGFMFFLDWANHNLNSVVSAADAHGPLGRTVAYLNCEVLPLLTAVGKINPNVRLLVALLNPPSEQECTAAGISVSVKAGVANAHAATSAGGGR
jgi:phospholipid/cholesterol/gamma-HCH transport system substrate-binding protein